MMEDVQKKNAELEAELASLRAEVSGLKAELASAHHPLTSSGSTDGFLERVVSSSLSGVYIYNIVEGCNEYINTRYTDITGWTLDEINAMSSEEFALLFHPSEREDVFSHMAEISQTKNTIPLEIEYRFKSKDGHWIWCLSRDAAFEFSADGTVVSFIGTFVDITTRKEIEEKLKESQLQAVEANEAKSVFLSRMSHELRTPLNAIIGFSQLLMLKIKPEVLGALHASPKNIHNAGLHLLQLVNDILEIVQIEQGKLNVELQTCSLEDVVKSSVVLCQGFLEQPDVTVQKNNLAFNVMSDPRRLNQIMTNLISNAIKYNRKGGAVTIEARETNAGEIEICVTDTGVGIPEKDQALLFEPFTRLQYADSSLIEGTGLGLTLTKYLVEEMGGRIDFDSTEGQGSRFFVTLKKGDEGVNEQPVKDTQSPLESSSKGRQILYIEDDKQSRELMKSICEIHPNITLQMGGTAEVGIELAKKHVPDLIFLDLNLPGMDGFSALEILRQMPELKDTSIVALSADALPAQVEKAMEAGFDDYFTKPVDVEKINTFIQACST